MTGFSRAVRTHACLGIHFDSDASPVCTQAPFPHGFGALRYAWHVFEQCLETVLMILTESTSCATVAPQYQFLRMSLCLLSIRKVAEKDAGGVRR